MMAHEESGWGGGSGFNSLRPEVGLTSGSPVGHTAGWRCMATDDANCYSTVIALSLCLRRVLETLESVCAAPDRRVLSS
jgi:hypothetical protein